MICPVDTKNLSTFKIGSQAHSMISINIVQDIQTALQKIESVGNKFFVLGGGSNTIFGDNLHNLTILKNEIPGIQVIESTLEYVLLKVGAGVIWDEFVEYCCQHNFSGIENLSLIPGTVGAAPVQNIGAYGVEVKDFIESVEAYDILGKKMLNLSNKECNFDYRSSIFKQHRNRFVITHVIFKLLKNTPANISSYKDVFKYFEGAEKTPTIREVRDAIISIRQSKLPDPDIIPNCGSFFKNPLVNIDTANRVRQLHKDAPLFPYKDKFKIGAGFLIDQCGFKGKNINQIIVYERNALVLTNPNNANLKDLESAIKKIKDGVRSKFNIELEEEVNIVN